MRSLDRGRKRGKGGQKGGRSAIWMRSHSKDETRMRKSLQKKRRKKEGGEHHNERKKKDGISTAEKGNLTLENG